jgi:hypothetical protein
MLPALTIVTSLSVRMNLIRPFTMTAPTLTQVGSNAGRLYQYVINKNQDDKITLYQNPKVLHL